MSPKRYSSDPILQLYCERFADRTKLRREARAVVETNSLDSILAALVGNLTMSATVPKALDVSPAEWSRIRANVLESYLVVLVGVWQKETGKTLDLSPLYPSLAEFLKAAERSGEGGEG